MKEPEGPVRPETGGTMPARQARVDGGSAADATGAWPAGSAPAPARRGGRPAIVIGAVLVLALICGAATYVALGRAGDDATPTTLALAFHRGDETTFRIHAAMHGSVTLGSLGEQPIDGDMSETLHWDVVRVADGGAATVRVSVTDASGSIMGSPATPGDSTMTLTVSPDGRVLAADGTVIGSTGSPGMGAFPGVNQVTPILPDHAVKPGDSWDKRFSQDLPFGSGAITYTAHSSFLRYEEFQGVRAAVIQTRYTVPIDVRLDLRKMGALFGGGDVKGLDGKNAVVTISGSGASAQTSWLDLDAGDLLRTNSTGDFDMTMSMPMLKEELGADSVRMSATFSMDLTRR